MILNESALSPSTNFVLEKLQYSHSTSLGECYILTQLGGVGQEAAVKDGRQANNSYHFPVAALQNSPVVES